MRVLILATEFLFSKEGGGSNNQGGSEHEPEVAVEVRCSATSSEKQRGGGDSCREALQPTRKTRVLEIKRSKSRQELTLGRRCSGEPPAEVSPS